MSFAPPSLIEVRRYIAEKAGVPRSNMSIRSARSARGYHAGESQIFGPNGQGWKDYSVKNPRNKAGLSEASSAIDIKLPVKQLKALVVYLLAGAKDGSLDVFEIIGPDSTGKANYWSIATDWLPKPKWAPKSHEWHIHLGLPRDTEFADRVAIFRPFFEAAAPEPEPDPEVQPDPAPTLTDVEALLDENEALKGTLRFIADLVQSALA